MKKSLLTVLSLLILLASVNVANAKSNSNNDVMKGIKLYMIKQ